MKNLLTQWKTEEENLKINLIKNLLTQWKTEEKNRKIGGDMPLIDRELNGNLLLIDIELSSNLLLINKELAELQNDAQGASLLKLTELAKKLFKFTKIRKEKPYSPISYSLTCFIELVTRPRFCFAKGLAGLTDVLAMSGAESRGEEVAICFFG